MQIDTDKADIINKEYNKSKLQNLVDTQQRNIDLVMKRLENDKNKIDVDVTIPLEVINNITSLIHDSPNIPNEVKKTMIDKPLKGTGATSNKERKYSSGMTDSDIDKVIGSKEFEKSSSSFIDKKRGGKVGK